jgi:hypothetical protein
MSLENDSVFTKLQADLNIGLLLRLMMFKWACQAKHTILEVLTITEDATTNHAHHLFTHGDAMYQGLHFLKSISLDISSLLALDMASVRHEKEELVSKLSIAVGMHRGTL